MLPPLEIEMSKTPIRAEIVETKDGRFVQLIYADGSEKLLSVDPSPKPKRTPRKPPTRVCLNESRRTDRE